VPHASARTASLTPLANGWTWVDVPQSNCDDGSPTGYGVNQGTGPDLVIYFQGGGACWDATTCLVDRQSAHGPFGRTQFATGIPALGGSILDRSVTGNPFATATLVYIPYCTGDLHAGNNVASYVNPGTGATVSYRHVGHANAMAFLSSIAATWPAPRRLVIAGSSAGGYGALMNYASFRAAFHAGTSYLIDDSGPPLPNGLLSQTILTDLYANWNLGALLDPQCNCRNGFLPLLSELVATYPVDHMSLLSSEQDDVIRAYYQLTPAQFTLAIQQATVEVMKPTPNARYFLVPGDSHDMLASPALFAQGIPLTTWLSQQLIDDPSWIDEAPP
jgi:hypothetical protein